MKPYFQLDKNIIHLNHAAVAPWPVVTRDAVIAFAEENSAIGSQRYDIWLQTEQQLKQKLALLINASSSDEIAILKNTSEGLSLIAQGLSFKAGDNIIIPAEEFPSNKVVWQALETQGVKVRLIPVQAARQAEQALISAMDKDTRLLSCSSVQYARGLRLDLNVIGEACKQNNTLFCVDAIQSLGAISFDVEACLADFVVADGHKWMCGPEGTALFYCRKQRQDSLHLTQYGWHMLQHAFDFSHQHDSIQIAETAQRFECGSPNMLGITALNASLGLLLDIGIDEVQQALVEKTEYLFRQLASFPDIQILTPTDKGKYAGIVTFQKLAVDNVKLQQHLQDNNVICAYRGDGIRFSPHFYTEPQLLDKALEIVSDYI
ncbi:MAG: aminotransferase class V-fold PLP-dependent enzyme [Gammaproteobacteria bacterium]|jgi:selenocysteine lyase/cysteine desulfurase|nr:aminotransferase class V-fold PLP-dependent enzyme [Gammaproteobacteria bacterium]